MKCSPLAALFGWVIAAGLASSVNGQRAERPMDPPLPGVPFDLRVALQSDDLPIAGSPGEALPPPDPLQRRQEENGVLLSLAEAEQTTLSRHPNVLQSIAEVRAARGAWLQVGLKPNLLLGYAASEIGNEGRAGQQGLYYGQTFVRGGKLELNRAVASHEIIMREQDVIAAEQVVLTDTRIAFYELLVLHAQADILRQLVDLTRQAQTTAKRLFEAGDSPKTDYLQARIELEQILLDVRTTEIERTRATQVLATRMAVPRLPGTGIDGNLGREPVRPEWQSTLDQVLASHPAIIRALADVQRARFQVARERAEVIPDLNQQLVVQHDTATEDTLAGIQTTFQIPLWNRNQGAIAAAWAELRAAEQRVEQARLELRRELAEHFNEFFAAHQKVITYKQEILPQAAETQQLTAQAYRQGELSFLNYLTAQRTYFQANLRYLDAVRSFWNGYFKVIGMLPPAPTDL